MHVNSSRLCLLALFGSALFSLASCQMPAPVGDYPYPQMYESAVERKAVLPLMSREQVTGIWGQPSGKSANGNKEEWTYPPNENSPPPQNPEISLNVKVYFADGKVERVVNGNMKQRPLSGDWQQEMMQTMSQGAGPRISNQQGSRAQNYMY